VADPAALLRAHGLRATVPRLRVLAALGSCEPADHRPTRCTALSARRSR
jgi:Fe2+ or Zn2+ uptake regulation protein